MSHVILVLINIYCMHTYWHSVCYFVDTKKITKRKRQHVESKFPAGNACFSAASCWRCCFVKLSNTPAATVTYILAEQPSNSMPLSFKIP